VHTVGPFSSGGEFEPSSPCSADVKMRFVLPPRSVYGLRYKGNFFAVTFNDVLNVLRICVQRETERDQM
jgi:hypothetical protein